MNTTCLLENNTVNYKLSDGWLEFVVLFYVSATLLAVAGNLLVLLTVIRRPPLHRVSYYLVAALSLEDLFQSGIVGTNASLATINGCWSLGGATCDLFGYLTTSLLGVEYLLLGAITADRYIACCMPLKYALLVTQRRCKSVIAGCWIYPAIVAILPWIGFSSYEYVTQLQWCVIEWSGRPLAVTYMTFIGGTTFVPCTVAIVVCQIRIYRQVKKVTDQPLPQVAHSGTSSTIAMVSSRPTKAALTVSLITGIYFLKWMPYTTVRFIILCVEWQKLDAVIMSNLGIATVCMFIVSKIANPIVYGVYNRSFRRECIKLLWK